MVGPFIFFDQMGPAEFLLGAGMDVRPHPHIGLSTVTYLFDGQIIHRDSLGTVVPIRPGELNWMTAGRGIAHSERTPPELRSVGTKLFGIQSWIALSAADEETEPAFLHYGANDLPVLEHDGKVVRVIAGSLLGASSPVRTSSPMFYADISLGAGASVPLDPLYDERAIYTVVGRLRLQATSLAPRNFSSFGQATASPSGQTGTPTSWRSVGSPWTAPGTSGGISYLREEIASNRPKLIGRWQGLTLFPATPNSSLFPNLRPDGQSPNATDDGT
jgi:redox-sensitive bicupin YhaK (pirin superfamily)